MTGSSVFERLQMLFEIAAQMLLLCRQLQRIAEMRAVPVTVETGLVGRNLEQNATGCAEVDRPEIIPVDDRRDLIAGIQQGLAHLKLLFAVFDRESDMVNRAAAKIGKRRTRHHLDVDGIGAIAGLKR